MSNVIKYIGFDIDKKQRCNIGGGGIFFNDKLKLLSGSFYTLRFLLYSNINTFYSTTSTNFELSIREKRQSTTDIIFQDAGSFYSSLWESSEEVSLIQIYDLIGGEFIEGDKIKGSTSNRFANCLGFSKDNGNLIYKPQTLGQHFTLYEQIKPSYGYAGFKDYQGRIGQARTALSYNASTGLIACELDLDTIEMINFLDGKEYSNLILELKELDSSDNSNVLGQCEIQIKNSFVISDNELILDGGTA